MTRRYRPAVSVLALTVIIVMLSFVFFIIAEADHDCTGEDCPVCCQIGICQQTLKTASHAAAAVCIVAAACVFSIRMLTYTKDFVYTVSLVSLRVKLSN